MYRSTPEVCQLTLYPETLLKLFINSRSHNLSKPTVDTSVHWPLFTSVARLLWAQQAPQPQVAGMVNSCCWLVSADACGWGFSWKENSEESQVTTPRGSPKTSKEDKLKMCWGWDFLVIPNLVCSFWQLQLLIFQGQLAQWGKRNENSSRKSATNCCSYQSAANFLEQTLPTPLQSSDFQSSKKVNLVYCCQCVRCFYGGVYFQRCHATIPELLFPFLVLKQISLSVIGAQHACYTKP